MDTNYFGVINTVEAALPHMDCSGFIVTSSSISALSASPNSGAYAASKAAIDRWVEGRILRRCTNTSEPSLVVARIGFVDTPMIKGLSHAEVLAITAEAAAKRMAGGLRSGQFCIWVARRSVIIFAMLALIGIQPRIRAMNAAFKLKCWLESGRRPCTSTR
jgi:NAD(P)-dependent dehydrogenase (short-subunit alcohol dehydrogenase family)